VIKETKIKSDKTMDTPTLTYLSETRTLTEKDEKERNMARYILKVQIMNTIIRKELSILNLNNIVACRPVAKQ
jgi:hypothetical protein